MKRPSAASSAAAEELRVLRSAEANLHQTYVAGDLKRGAYLVAISVLHTRYTELGQTAPCACLACREVRG